MFIRTTLVAAIAAAHLSSHAQADSTAEIRQQLQQLREQYEARIKALEQRLDAAEKAQAAAAAPAPTPAPSPPPLPAPSPATPSAPGLALSAVLTGTYANLRNDPDTYRIQGFIPGGDELGPGSRSFSLGESEITLAANVDPYFSGRLTFALTPDNEAEVEEAYFRTSALPRGFGLIGGRFLSSIGYLNSQHAHTWDFVDAPLAHQAFFGGQHHTDGVQLKWIAPTETYVELTSELGVGNSFPGNDRNRNSPGSFSLGARVGSDIAESANWRAGFSYLRAESIDRTYDDLDSTGTAVTNAFTGESDTYVLDGVFKWAPAGNVGTTSFKLQGEYFRRRETGTLSYDIDSASLGAASGDYGSRQSGWYLQGVYQFARLCTGRHRVRAGRGRLFGVRQLDRAGTRCARMAAALGASCRLRDRVGRLRHRPCCIDAVGLAFGRADRVASCRGRSAGARGCAVPRAWAGRPACRRRRWRSRYCGQGEAAQEALVRLGVARARSSSVPQPFTEPPRRPIR